MDNTVKQIYDQIVAIVESVVAKKTARDRWGTAQTASSDGSVSILIDGAESATPCQTVSKVMVGDRVLLNIDPFTRTTVVKGNYSKPATDDEYAINAFGNLVRQVNEIRADTGRFGELFAEEADVHILIAEDATVEQLEAARAKVAELEAQSISANVITTTQATIDLLKADNIESTTIAADGATVKVLSATSAAISSLDTNIATIHDLRSDIASIQQLDVESLTATAAAIEELDVAGLQAAAADIAQLKVDTAFVNALTGKTIGADELTAVNATIDTLNAHGLNAEAAALAAASIKSLLAQSGWFEEVTVTGDASVTGQLKSVLLDGDTARFRNIYANALKLLGPDGLYHALNFQGLDETVETLYSSVTPGGSENPSQEGWYETHIDSYELSEDSEITSGATYYEATTTYSYALTEDESIDSEKTYYAPTYSYALTEDESLDAEKTYYVIDDGEYVVVGEPDVSDIATYYERTLTGYEPVSEPDVSDIEGYYERSSTTTYSEVTPAGTEDPSEEGWYVPDETSYVESADTTVVSGKEYFTATDRIADEDVRAFASAYGESLDNGLHGSHIIAETITADQIDATSVRAALLEVLNIVVGLRSGFHIEIESDTGGGSMNFVSGEKTVADRPWSYANENGIDNQGNRIAYLQADNSGDSLFYMNKAVVMTDLRFARWQWKARSNGNLTLKWVG